MTDPASLSAVASTAVLPSAGDRAVRSTLFWLILCATAIAVATAHWLQHRYTFVSSPVDPATGRVLPRMMPHGSYGAFLPRSDAASNPPGRQPIVLLGNSVYQTCGIVERMQGLAEADGGQLAFVNRAQTGAGMHDYFAHMVKAVDLRPRLLVVAFIDLAFTPDYMRWSLPRFRTDADQMLFDSDVVLDVPWSFLHREFTLSTGLDSLVSSLFPYKRLDVLMRYEVDLGLYWPIVNTLHVDPVIVRVLFPLPVLNLTQDWVDRRDAPRSAQGRAQPWPELHELVTEFATVCQQNDVPVLFLHQEAASEMEPDVLPALRAACAPFAKVRVVDLRSAFVRTQFIDQVHPHEAARDAYAARHYKAILQALEELPAGAPGARSGK